VVLHAPQSSSPVLMGAVWIQASSVTPPHNVPMGQMSRIARTVSPGYANQASFSYRVTEYKSSNDNLNKCSFERHANKSFILYQ